MFQILERVKNFFCVNELWLKLPLGSRFSKMIANWFIAPLQFCIGIVHRLLIFRKARYSILKTASSDGNIARFLMTFRNVIFKDSIVLVVLDGFPDFRSEREHRNYPDPDVSGDKSPSPGNENDNVSSEE